MDWIEGEDGAIYRPIRPLFYAPVYYQTTEICWEEKYYLSQKKMMVHMLRLQQQNQLLSHLTGEDMTDCLVERSKTSLRERLWRFSLEDQEETEVQPLLKLTWQVNINLKMRDIEFEARMVLDSPEANSPCFREPKIMRLAEESIRGLVERHQQEPGSSLHGPQEVVMEVVPKVLQGLWVHPPFLSSVRPSLRLGPLAVGVAKAVMNKLPSCLLDHQLSFSRSVRDNVVLSVLEKIRELYLPHVLEEELRHFGPQLMANIVQCTVEGVSLMFEPPDVRETSDLLKIEEVEDSQTSQPAVMEEAVDSTSHHAAVSEEPSLEETTAVSPETADSAAAGLTPSAEAGPERDAADSAAAAVQDVSVVSEAPKETEMSELLNTNEVKQNESSHPDVMEESVNSTSISGALSQDFRLEEETEPESPDSAASAPQEPLTPSADLTSCLLQTEEQQEQSCHTAAGPYLLTIEEVKHNKTSQPDVMEEAVDSTSHYAAVTELEETERPDSADSARLEPVTPSAEAATVQDHLTSCLVEAEEQQEQSCHTAADSKKTKEGRVRRLFRRVCRALFCCCLPKSAEQD